ncbi:ABC transporter substrate-binding protein [Clostridia bacterium]|nr:ABC transporter substrate-binding protein [Clostridia bacterium]
MKIKRIIAITCSLMLALFMLAACGTSSDTSNTPSSTPSSNTSTVDPGTDPTPEPPDGNQFANSVTLKVWASQEEQDEMGKMVDAFKALYPATTWDITFGVVGEPDAKGKISEDPEAAADVFHFANDQLRDLMDIGALYEVTANKADIIARNGAGSIESATYDGKLYAFPFTADNGYFLYYDKSVFSEDDVKSLDKMLEVAGAAGKKVFMDVSNGWYIASFFLAKGNLSITADGKQICDFNNADGLAAGEAIKAFTASDAFITGDDAVLTGGIGGSIAAGVSGTWNAEAIQTALGDNYAATKLPTFTVGGSQVQMSSFGGFKLIGVNSLTKYPLEALALADYLSNEENQMTRFKNRQLGPSNTNAANSAEVQANIALAALAEQSAFATSQNDVLGTYWTPAEGFGTAMEAKDYSKPIQDLLDEMVNQIQG